MRRVDFRGSRCFAIGWPDGCPGRAIQKGEYYARRKVPEQHRAEGHPFCRLLPAGLGRAAAERYEQREDEQPNPKGKRSPDEKLDILCEKIPMDRSKPLIQKISALRSLNAGMPS